jgi:ABC-type glycerol-3-phosphate transport system permease component
MPAARQAAGLAVPRVRPRRYRLFRIASYAVTWLMVAAFFLPFYWMVNTSLKTLSEVGEYPPRWIPSPAEWSNYPQVFSDLPFARFIANSLEISLLQVLFSVVSSSVVAFGFARTRFPGREIWFIIMLSTMMLPFVVTLIPQYVIVYDLHLLNSYIPLVVPSLFASPFFVFLLRQFMLTIPRDLDEAAQIDGCGWWQIYRWIVLPLTRPALAAVAIFAFVGSWNEFLTPLVYLNQTDLFTVALGVQLFSGQYSSYYNLMMAAALISLLPVIIVFLIAQRYFVEGVILTGLKV